MFNVPCGGHEKISHSGGSYKSSTNTPQGTLYPTGYWLIVGDFHQQIQYSPGAILTKIRGIGKTSQM